jgi:hypothetical protein
MDDNRKTLLLEIKEKAGLATPEELDELENTPVIIGNGLVVPRRYRDDESWYRRWSGPVGPDGYATGQDDPADAPLAMPAAPPSNVTHTNDGLILCKPGNEPAPAGKPGYKPIDGTLPRDKTLHERFAAARRPSR